MVGYQKVGGLHFIRLGRISVSFCRTSRPMREDTLVRFELPIDIQLVALLIGAATYNFA